MMQTHRRFARKVILSSIACLFTLSGSAWADERGDLEQLRATTMSLIEALVDSGVLPREKADKLIRDAEEKARKRLAESPPAPAAELGKDGKRVVRVAYVPESMKLEIRDQVRQEVLAQAKSERWGDPGALPSWLDRFQFEGDIRVRNETLQLDKGNTGTGGANIGGGNMTRGADLAYTDNSTLANLTAAGLNPQDDSNRWRLRARFGFNAKVAEGVSAGFRIATGNTAKGPTSTNQTQGQNLNKYSVVLDRGYLTLSPTPWLSLTGGRFANPFFSTDLVWAEDLNFEGIALKLTPRVSPTLGAFASAGWFPLRTDDGVSNAMARNITAVQAGLDWTLSSNLAFKAAASLYQYNGMEGQLESDARYNLGNPVSDYGKRYEYSSAMRQRGNTLFLVNAPFDDGLHGTAQPLYWGLASGFREFNLTGSLDIANFDPTHIILTGDFVKNLAFDRNKIEARTGTAISDGRNIGYLAKVLVGNPHIEHEGEWNASLTYRWLGSDAVLDAFTNSDFGLGGTNSKGFIIGLNYGIAKNTWISTRWMSSDLIDSMAPKVTGTSTAATKMSLDLLQVDLNAKF